MGRKPVGPAVAVRLPPDLTRSLDVLAREWGCTRSEAIRLILRLHLTARRRGRPRSWTGPVLIRQGGLRFWWDREGLVTVARPSGAVVGVLEVRADGLRASLDEVHEAIDAYCASRLAS